MLKRGIRARDIMTKKAFENAITMMMALGKEELVLFVLQSMEQLHAT